jgi:hypothetical protein
MVLVNPAEPAPWPVLKKKLLRLFIDPWLVRPMIVWILNGG